ncbi:MAG: hypothetical protein AAGF12_03435 [Myxococcota bacterium]
MRECGVRLDLRSCAQGPKSPSAGVTGAALLAVLLSASSVDAQGAGGVANSGMGQGEANISTRSDVTMGIESGPGTSGAKLQRMVDAVTTSLGRVRDCYGNVTGDRPEVTGVMRIRIRVPRQRGTHPEFSTLEDTSEDVPLGRCVRRALREVNYRRVDRPAEVTVRLEFTNSAAAGTVEVQRRRQEEAVVPIQRTPEGLPSARGGTPGGEVTFVVVGRDRNHEDGVAAVQRSVRAAIAGMLDCRRRAGRRDMNSAGEITLSLVIPRRGRVRIEPTNNTVQHERAPQCVARVLRRAQFPAAAAGQVELKVRFSGRQALDVPTRP